MEDLNVVVGKDSGKQQMKSKLQIAKHGGRYSLENWKNR
jgi:hypothetical protein